MSKNKKPEPRYIACSILCRKCPGVTKTHFEEKILEAGEASANVYNTNCALCGEQLTYTNPKVLRDDDPETAKVLEALQPRVTEWKLERAERKIKELTEKLREEEAKSKAYETAMGLMGGGGARLDPSIIRFLRY